MRVRVRFKVNTETGEVEQFLVEDIGTELEPDHEAVHDRIAHTVGKIVERRPAPEQVVGGLPDDEATPLVRADEEPAAAEHEEARE